MTLEALQKAMKIAMKGKFKIELEVIRGIIAAVKKAAIDKRCEIDEELVNEILLKEKKTVQEMIDTCPKERVDLLEEYEHKLALINIYAPKLIAEPAEVRSIVEKILTEANIDLKTANKGIIMKTVMPKVKGKVDMAVVNKVISEILN